MSDVMYKGKKSEITLYPRLFFPQSFIFIYTTDYKITNIIPINYCFTKTFFVVVVVTISNNNVFICLVKCKYKI